MTVSSWKSHQRPDQVSAEYFARMGQKSELVVVRGLGGPENGKWYDRGRMKVRDPDEDDSDNPYVISTAHVHFGPTGEFETRDDGAKAEVFRPVVCPEDCERKSDHQGTISCQGCDNARIIPPRELCGRCVQYNPDGWSRL